jgi:hypothetical protein
VSTRPARILLIHVASSCDVLVDAFRRLEGRLGSEDLVAELQAVAARAHSELESESEAPTVAMATQPRRHEMGYQQQQHQPMGDGGGQYGYPPQFYGGGFGRGRMGYAGRRDPIETKPFFMTSEFLATLLCVIAVAITAASVADLDSRLSTALISGLVAAYTISRGIAKSGTRSHSFDPRENLTFGQRSNEGDRETAGVR